MLLLLAACADPNAAAYDAARLAADIEGYEAWPHPTDWPSVHPSCEGAHGSYVQIWQDARIDSDVAAGRPYSEGGLFVLEGYQDLLGTPKAFVVMRKNAGSDGSWFWGHYDETHTPIQTGDLPACAACHAAEPGRVRHDEGKPAASLGACSDDTGIAPPG